MTSSLVLSPFLYTGSKGNNINLQQIMGTVGQQNVSGERIGFGFRGRSLPHFTKHDVGHLSRGFVVNPFLRYVAISVRDLSHGICIMQ